MTVWAILPAAGVGRRMGSPIPKQYLSLAGKPVIQHSIEKLLQLADVAKLVIALHPQDSHFSQLQLPAGKIIQTKGGDTRQATVLNSLRTLAGQAADQDWVLVHDAVRPCVLVADIERLLTAIAGHRVGGLLASPQADTLKIADPQGRVLQTVDRSNYWQALTPQVFRFGILREAMEAAEAEGLAVTDEASAVEALVGSPGFSPAAIAQHQKYLPLLVQGNRNNIKLTRESDLALAAAILSIGQEQT